MILFRFVASSVWRMKTRPHPLSVSLSASLTILAPSRWPFSDGTSSKVAGDEMKGAGGSGKRASVYCRRPSPSC